MSSVVLYFQYTHLSNTELAKLRNFVTVCNGKSQLVSPKTFVNLQMPITFGKLLVVDIDRNFFKFELIATLLSTFPSIHLLFINLDSFLLSPTLYLSYTLHKLSMVTPLNLYCLSVPLNSTRLIISTLRYQLISINILFQETLLYKNSIQYIC